MTRSSRPSLPDSETLAGLPADGGPEWNRLVFESSPYLLQHAANPVDWFPWGEAAFQKARSENKPVFLSIGYATCHWCHVMEHESFEDEEVAALLNRHFVCIKVDKEERPDIDDIYMAACQAMTGSGGWPLTALLTHDKKPFFAGTYFPKKGFHGRPGMMELLPRVDEFWREHRGEAEKNADQLTEHVRRASSGSPGRPLTERTLKTAYEQLAHRFDDDHGGFGSRPKFPTPHNFTFLLRYWRRSGEDRALRMVERTLSAMRRGGIFDHVGFGFHRYSTDEHWLLPHFEKMLYDQALLAVAYLEAYQATGNAELAQTAREIFEYVLRDMTAPEGGFYSAEDADSEGVEGKFYVWKPEEVKAVLGEKEGDFFCRIYHIEEDGNFLEEASGHASGDNIPHLTEAWAAIAENEGLETEELRQRLETARKALFLHREKRIHPLKDDKILTDWNGMMIAALSMGAAILDEARYREAAVKAADFALNSLRDGQGRLMKRYRAGKAGLPAHLDDYAFMIWGLVELYQCCFEPRYLAEAIALTDHAVRTFRGSRSGAFYLTSNDGERLIMRSQRIYDGAVPSGNSVMAANLLRLSRLTGRTDYQDYATSIFTAFAGEVGQYPSMSNHLMGALDFMLGPSHEVVIVGKAEDEGTISMIRGLNRNYLPNKVVLRHGGDGEMLADLAPFTKDQKTVDGKAAAYVCRDFACSRPTTDPEKMLELLRSDSH